MSMVIGGKREDGGADGILVESIAMDHSSRRTSQNSDAKRKPGEVRCNETSGLSSSKISQTNPRIDHQTPGKEQNLSVFFPSNFLRLIHLSINCPSMLMTIMAINKKTKHRNNCSIFFLIKKNAVLLVL